MSTPRARLTPGIEATVLKCTYLGPSGLRSTQFSLIMLVRGAKRIRITELAEEAVMDRTTLKRNLELLEREGLVRIEAGEDARVREVSVTPAAEERLAAALPLWQRMHAHVTGELGQGRADRLLADLSAVIATTEARA